MKGLAAIMILLLLIAGHQPPVAVNPTHTVQADTGVAMVPQATVIPISDTVASEISKDEPSILTGAVNPVSLVDYAKTLVGTPYLYGSTDPRRGFDCSGFITYVFNHFNIKVPRSSVEFTHIGADVDYMASKPGDLILFTGTDSTIRVVGHMGIIVSNENNQVYFIHSSSGKQYGVIVTELNPYYLSRFIRIARVFPDKADRNPMVPINRLIVVDSVHQVTKMKTIKLNQLDSTKNKVTTTKKVVKKTPAKKSSTKKKPITSSKKTSQKTTSAKKKSSTSTSLKKTQSSSKKKVASTKKKAATTKK